MKLVGTLTALLAGSSTAYHVLQELSFKEWKDAHNVTFSSVGEDRARSLHFERNKDFVRNHNARFNSGAESFFVSLNKFAAMSNEEFMSIYLPHSWEAGTYGAQPGPVGASQYSCPQSYSSTSHSGSYDGSKYVTSVKDQGSCGSCWTFGAGAAIEGAMCKAGKYNCNSWSGVSTQQLVDCASHNNQLSPYDNNGCNGGFQSNALRYVFQYSHGIDSWSNYKYTGKEGTCNYSASKSVGTISSCGRLGHAKNEDNMCAMLEHKGPSTVAIDASGSAFQLYSGGVYNPGTCSTSRLNHAVTATAFGKTSGTNTMTIKNSWGSSWGDHGYVHFARNGKNTCGAFSEGQYAIV